MIYLNTAVNFSILFINRKKALNPLKNCKVDMKY